jgi:lysophospholipase L1-like esterase
MNGTLSSNETIALSDGGAGGTFSPTSLTFTSNNAGTPQSFTYTPASAGTFTVSGTGSGNFSALASCQVTGTTGPVTVHVNDGNLAWSPYNWRVAGSSYACSVNPGAYVRLGFSGTSLKMNLNISGYASAFTGGVSYYPVLRWSVDNGPMTTHQIGSGDSQITIASSLSSGSHTFYLEIVSNDQGVDRWGTSSADPASAVFVQSFVLDAGASTIAPTLGSKRIIIFGDSITEGVKVLGNLSNANSDAVNNDGGLSYAAFLGRAFGAEYGQIGYGGLGWIVPSSGSSPPGAVPFFTPGNDTNSSWNKYSAAASRLTSGLFSPAPDIIFVMLGANDRAQSGSSVTASVQAALPALRAAAGTNCWIFLINETINPNMSAYILTGYDAYQTSTPDAKCKIIETGIAASGMFSFTSGATQYASDGIHPSYYFSGYMAAAIADLAQGYMEAGSGGSGSSAGYSRSRVVNG